MPPFSSIAGKKSGLQVVRHALKFSKFGWVTHQLHYPRNIDAMAVHLFDVDADDMLRHCDQCTIAAVRDVEKNRRVSKTGFAGSTKGSGISI